MVFGPAVLALLGSSLMVSAITVGAVAAGLAVVVGWDPEDGGAAQLRRERRQLLVEAIVRVAFSCQLLSLLLFVACVDHLHLLFTGAMCAVGTLMASPLGFTALGLKLWAFVLCALWLLVARSSEGCGARRLVQLKHLSLIPVAGVVLADGLVQALFFADLDPEVITSCCAALFGREAPGAAAGVAALPDGPSRVAFLGAMGLTLATGWRCQTSGRGGPLFAACACLTGVVTALAIVIWVAPDYYQLPTHHCPLCLLAAEHGFVGYPLYVALLVAVVAGAGRGLVGGAAALDPTGPDPAASQRRLCRISVASFLVVLCLALWPAVAAGLRVLGG